MSAGALPARVTFSGSRRGIAVDLRRLRSALRRILSDHRRGGLLSVVFVDDAAIRALNRRFLGLDEPTDVLSFPLEMETAADAAPGPAGEVVVSTETARRVAARRRLDPARELALYAIHGALHLAGRDDGDAAARRAMRREERRYLAVYDGAAAGPRAARKGSRSSRRRGGPRRGRRRRPAPA